MRFLSALALAIAFVACQADASHAAFRHVWSRMLEADARVSLSDNAFYFSPRLVAAGDAGDCFVTFVAANHVSFGEALSGPGNVVARLDASGEEIWSRTLASGQVSVQGIATAENGTLVICGQYGGTVDLGGGPMTSVGGTDVFVVKLDAAGSVLWQKSFGDKNEQYPTSVTVASNGDVIVIGTNRGVVNFGGGLIRSNGGDDVFLVRLKGSDGGHVWSRGYGQIGSQTGLQVAASSDGRVALTCELSSGGIDVGGGLALPLGDGDIVLAVLDADGGYMWSRILASNQGETTRDVAIDSAGNIYLCGWFAATLDAGGGVMVDEPSAQFTGFAASYGPAGDFRWSYALKDSLRSSGEQIAIDGEGNCLFLATKYQSVTLAGTSLPRSGFLLIGFDNSGIPTMASGYGEAKELPGGVRKFAVARMAMHGDSIYLGGYTTGIVDLGGGELTPVYSSSAFIGRLDIRRPARVTIGDFTARADGADVELRWTIASGEALSNYYLTRSIDGSSQAQAILSAHAEDGTFSFVDHDAHPGHLHKYELTVETALGDPVSSSVSINVPALQTSLGQNTPNPFNPLTSFPYALAVPAQVSIGIYDINGALIARLDQGMQPAGRHEAKWAGHNWSGNLVASGVYFYRLEGAGDIPARKMILLK